MSYAKAENILPQEIIELIQKYVDGEYLYIPRKKCNRKSWGENTNTKHDIKKRNYAIYKNYMNGMHVKALAEEYYLSIKSIQRIILGEKRKIIAK